MLPVLAPGDVGTVLEDEEFLAGLHPDLGGEPFPERGELPVVVLVIEPGVTHERRRLACHATTSRPCPEKYSPLAT
jgi:hypothetical protein